MQARKRKLIKTRFQLKLIGVFLGLASVSAVIQTLLVNHSLLKLLGRNEQANQALLGDLPGLLLGNLALSMGLLLPTMGIIGVLLTHRIAGPVYRFEQYLEAIARGERAGACSIRKNDEFQELCGLINQAFERTRSDSVTASSGLGHRDAGATPRQAA
jgi:hypothetical protein